MCEVKVNNRDPPTDAMEGASHPNVYPMHYLPGGLRKDPTCSRWTVALKKPAMSLPKGSSTHIYVQKKTTFFVCKSGLGMGDPNCLLKNTLGKLL